MLHLSVDVAALDTGRRLIEGMAVPYGETAQIGFSTYRFAPGSVRRARATTPLVLGHNEDAPVGVVSRLTDSEIGAQLQARIDRTPAGDVALEQARTGSRSGLSIGFEIERATTAPDGTINVELANIYEVSLVSVPAFAGATVERVAAHRDPEEEEQPEEEEETATNPDQLTIEADAEADDGEGDDDDQEEEETMETMEAAGRTPAILTATRATPPRELLAGEFVRHLIQAQHGNRESAAMLRAALTESISTDVSGLLPPTYERTVIGGKAILRPLYDAFRSRPLPGVGLLVNKPVWTTRPDGAWAATVDADATSTQVVIGSQSATVLRWDWAGAIPWVVVERSDPSIIDEVYGEAVEDFYADVEAKIYGELGAAAPGTATTLGAAIAEFFVATGNQRSPEIIIMAPDVWGRYADTGALAISLGQGDVSGDPLATSFAGIRAVTSGTLPPGETVLATRRAVDARVTEPVRLTANAIGALNVELAVVGEGLFDTDYPGELLKFAGVGPAAAAGTGPTRSK
jgi:HK97 family phage prohead protease